MKDNDKLALLYKNGYEDNFYVATGDVIIINGTPNVVDVFDSYHIKFDKFGVGHFHTHQFSNLEGIEFYLPNYKFYNLNREMYSKIRNYVFEKFNIYLDHIKYYPEKKESIINQIFEGIISQTQLAGTELDIHNNYINKIGKECFVVEHLMIAITDKTYLK